MNGDFESATFDVSDITILRSKDGDGAAPMAVVIHETSVGEALDRQVWIICKVLLVVCESLTNCECELLCKDVIVRSIREKTHVVGVRTEVLLPENDVQTGSKDCGTIR